MFLPDRYVRGTCPNCGTPDQYGDSCENCGATYSPLDLKDAVSTLSGTKPVARESEHLLLKLGAFESELREWVPKHVDASALAQARRVVQGGPQGLGHLARFALLRLPRSRASADKFFYVWFDAPIGYIGELPEPLPARGPRLRRVSGTTAAAPSSTISSAKTSRTSTRCSGRRCSRAPATASRAAVFVHGHLTVDGEKMSKRRGTFIPARIFAKHLDPDYLRYYYASKLGATIEDIDLNFADLVAKVNSRPRRQAREHREPLRGLRREARRRHAGRPVAGRRAVRRVRVRGRDASRRLRAARLLARGARIMALADRANQYIDEKKPWVLAKNPQAAAEVVGVCTLGLNLFRALIDLSQARAARARRARREAARGRRAALERRHGAAARPQDRALRAAAPAHRAAIDACDSLETSSPRRHVH